MLEKVGAALPLGFVWERDTADVDRPGEDEVGDEEPLGLDLEVLLRGRGREWIPADGVEEGLVIRGIEFLVVVFERDDEDVGLAIDLRGERAAPAVAEFAWRVGESDRGTFIRWQRRFLRFGKREVFPPFRAGGNR